LSYDDYWFGLYKLAATPGAPYMWYDGNPSPYRNWAPGEPNQATICVRYTWDGFADRQCNSEYYYTCKQRAGTVRAQTLISAVKSFN